MVKLPFRAASAVFDAAEHVPVAGSVVRDVRRSAHNVVDSASGLATAGVQTGMGALTDEAAVADMAGRYARLCGIWDEARARKGVMA